MLDLTFVAYRVENVAGKGGARLAAGWENIMSTSSSTRFLLCAVGPSSAI